MTSSTPGAILYNGKLDYCTPEWIWKKIQEFKPIDLDPCSNEQSTVPAKTKWYDHALNVPWSGAGLIYCNPPYGRGIADWMQRCASCSEAIALIPARTSEVWFHECVFEQECSVCFIKRRVTFQGASHPAAFPSCLVYYGPESDRFCDHFNSFGHCCRP